MNDEPALGPQLLRDAAHAVWGDTWQACLSRHVEVNSRTVRRWAAGDSPVPRYVAPELLTLCRIKRGMLSTTIMELGLFEERRMDFAVERG